MVESSGMASAQARIAEIQAQIGALQPAPTTTTTAAAGAGDFASTLQRVTAQSAGGSGSTGEQAVSIAEKYLGVPYVYGGSDPKTGLDCSGLVQVVYRRLGIELPRTTYDMVNVGTPVSRADLQPGDLVFSVGDKGQRVNGHVGIYAGNGKYVVAPHTGDVVKIANLPDHITAIRRIIPSGTGSAPSATTSSALTSALLGGGLLSGGSSSTAVPSAALGAAGSTASVRSAAALAQIDAARSIGSSSSDTTSDTERATGGPA
ncbi:MAG: C40 family peptidase [Acidimicrobiia bacterium]